MFVKCYAIGKKNTSRFVVSCLSCCNVQYNFHWCGFCGQFCCIRWESTYFYIHIYHLVVIKMVKPHCVHSYLCYNDKSCAYSGNQLQLAGKCNSQLPLMYLTNSAFALIIFCFFPSSLLSFVFFYFFFKITLLFLQFHSKFYEWIFKFWIIKYSFFYATDLYLDRLEVY